MLARIAVVELGPDGEHGFAEGIGTRAMDDGRSHEAADGGRVEGAAPEDGIRGVVQLGRLVPGLVDGKGGQVGEPLGLDLVGALPRGHPRGFGGRVAMVRPRRLDVFRPRGRRVVRGRLGGASGGSRC